MEKKKNITNMKRLVMDLDDTICTTENGDYQHSKPNKEVIEKLQKYKKEGFEIVISSSRNMRTYEGNVGKINIHTLPTIINWLKTNNVPFDEVIIGKPWCGFEGFYVDDKSIRPSEFVKKTYSEIILLLEKEKNNQCI